MREVDIKIFAREDAAVAFAKNVVDERTAARVIYSPHPDNRRGDYYVEYGPSGTVSGFLRSWERVIFERGVAKPATAKGGAE
jgi:hypothetical protein